MGSERRIINLHQGECVREQSGYGSLKLMTCTSIINACVKRPMPVLKWELFEHLEEEQA